jgi:hypothetical protein
MINGSIPISLKNRSYFFGPHQKGNAMEHQFSRENVSILHELDLGQHTLFIMSDGGIDLLVNDEQTPYLADNAISLDSDETYHLFISLREQFKQEGSRTC